MKATKASLAGVLILEPRVFGDERGFFLESYNRKTMAEVGIRENFVQDNHSFSVAMCCEDCIIRSSGRRES
jgi:dTDP-4-dehydrorhamnose 3,5-epimerase